MTEAEWKQEIIMQMEQVGTYHRAFKAPIDTLAQILAQRDTVYTMYLAEGGSPMVQKVSDRGAQNKALNPLLKTFNELNRDALAYWRDMGLTPAGLKRINEDALKKPKENALAEALRDLG